MRFASTILSVRTPGQGLTDITTQVGRWLADQSFGDGLLTLFLQHTSASLVIQENADPDVQRDLETFLRRLVPEGESWYRHSMEGPDDMPAHIKAALTGVHLSIPLLGGRMALGIWQGIYLFEHRRAAHDRRVVLQAIGA